METRIFFFPLNLVFEDNLQRGIFLDFVDIFWRDYCSMFFFSSRLFFCIFSSFPSSSSPFFPGPWRGCCGFSTSDSDSQDRRRSALLVFGFEWRRKQERSHSLRRKQYIFRSFVCACVYVFVRAWLSSLFSSLLPPSHHVGLDESSFELRWTRLLL